jgi:hypothetical protein
MNRKPEPSQTVPLTHHGLYKDRAQQFLDTLARLIACRARRTSNVAQNQPRTSRRQR